MGLGANMTSIMAGQMRPDRFYAISATVQALLIFFAFGHWASLLHIDYAHLPLLVQIHGLVFASWVLLYAGQTWWATTNNFRLHRPLGWVTAFLAIVIVVLGLITTAGSVQRGSVPPIFTSPIFLALNGLQLLFFVGLIALGILLRRHSDWHKRLMYAAAITFVFPALGRLLPMPLFGPYMLWVLVGAGLLFLFAGIVNDLITRGRIHPAYMVGLGAHLTATALIAPLAATPFVTGLAASLSH